MNDDKYFKRCPYCKKSLRNHNPQYCEHIWSWKYSRCKFPWNQYNKFHGFKWGPDGIHTQDWNNKSP